MYKFERYRQLGLADFNQPAGLKMNPENRWILIGAVERYRDRTGHYPQRVLADKIYRNRENPTFCKQHGFMLIHMQKNHCEISAG